MVAILSIKSLFGVPSSLGCDGISSRILYLKCSNPTKVISKTLSITYHFDTTCYA